MVAYLFFHPIPEVGDVHVHTLLLQKELEWYRNSPRCKTALRKRFRSWPRRQEGGTRQWSRHLHSFSSSFSFLSAAPHYPPDIKRVIENEKFHTSHAPFPSPPAQMIELGLLYESVTTVSQALISTLMGKFTHKMWWNTHYKWGVNVRPLLCCWSKMLMFNFLFR